MSQSAPANKLQTVKKAVHDFLHEKNAFTSVFELAEKYTKVSREYLFLGEFPDLRGEKDWPYIQQVVSKQQR